MKKIFSVLIIICVSVILNIAVLGNELQTQSDIISIENNISEKTVFEPVTVKINGQHLDNTHEPLIMDNITIVPLRETMESLGWDVKWIDATQEIVITRNTKKTVLQIGSDIMLIEDEKTTLPVAPIIIGETSYVPIRAIAEALDAIVGWENENSTATIYTGQTTSVLAIADYKVKIGSTTAELVSVCGEPTYKVVADKGLLWYVYSKFPAAFMAVATDGGIVCGYYTNSALFSTSDEYSYGDPLSDADNEYKLINGNSYKIELFYDTKDKILCAVKCLADGYSNNYDKNKSLENQARMGLDILNSFRYTHGKGWLKWNQYAAESCAQHSNYMAETGVLTHKGSDGSSAIERYLKLNPEANWRAWGENICAEAQDIFTCMNGWLNADYHRSIMLSDKTDAGIGFVYLPDGKFKYCTTMLLIK